uniref:Aminotransferase class I/classII domain-containing protein n=1 Tax=Ornithorhynchus anatinus TaxID=9258 RepID=A0A6I8N088_ORNAN
MGHYPFWERTLFPSLRTWTIQTSESIVWAAETRARVQRNGLLGPGLHPAVHEPRHPGPTRPQFGGAAGPGPGDPEETGPGGREAIPVGDRLPSWRSPGRGESELQLPTPGAGRLRLPRAAGNWGAANGRLPESAPHPVGTRGMQHRLLQSAVPGRAAGSESGRLLGAARRGPPLQPSGRDALRRDLQSHREHPEHADGPRGPAEDGGPAPRPRPPGPGRGRGPGGRRGAAVPAGRGAGLGAGRGRGGEGAEGGAGALPSQSIVCGQPGEPHRPGAEPGNHGSRDPPGRPGAAAAAGRRGVPGFGPRARLPLPLLPPGAAGAGAAPGSLPAAHLLRLPLLQPGRREKQAVLKALAEKARLTESVFNQAPGIRCNPVQGAVYSFPRISLPARALERAQAQGLDPDFFFCQSLLEETGILVAPGCSFGQAPGTHHLRLSLAPPLKTLSRTLRALTLFYGRFVEENS